MLEDCAGEQAATGRADSTQHRNGAELLRARDSSDRTHAEGCRPQAPSKQANKSNQAISMIRLLQQAYAKGWPALLLAGTTGFYRIARASEPPDGVSLVGHR